MNVVVYLHRAKMVDDVERLLNDIYHNLLCERAHFIETLVKVTNHHAKWLEALDLEVGQDYGLRLCAALEEKKYPQAVSLAGDYSNQTVITCMLRFLTDADSL